MRERALQFGETNNLVGIVTEPAPEEEGGLPGVILLNAGILHRIGPSRMNVKLARALARHGFTCLRFDFSGIGDSQARPDRLPFEESSVLEIQDAMNHLEATRDIGRFIIIGLCSGADAAYQGALADPRVVGLAPIDGHAYRTWRYYLHRYLPRLVRWESWKNLLTGKTYVGPWLRKLLGRKNATGPKASSRPGNSQVFQRPLPPREEVEKSLRTLVDRDVRMLHVFSAGLEHRYNYRTQFLDMFPSLDFRELVEVEFFGEADHTFTDLDQLEKLVATVTDWARSTWIRSEEAAGSARTPGERAA